MLMTVVVNNCEGRWVNTNQTFFLHPYPVKVFTKWECCKNRYLGLFYIPLTQNDCTRVCFSKPCFHTFLFPYQCLLTHNNSTIQSPRQTKSIPTGKPLILTNRLCRSKHSGEQNSPFCLHSLISVTPCAW